MFTNVFFLFIDTPKGTEYTPLGLPNFLNKDALIRFHAGFLSARIGEWLFTVALNWVVFVQTESPLLLGVINACRLLPTLLLSLPAGRMADQYNRRDLNYWNALANALTTTLIGLALYLHLPFSGVAALVVLRAVATASEGPFRNAYLCNLAEGTELKRAIATNASVMNLGRILGPVLAGALLSSVGALSTFLLAGATTIAYGLVLKTLPSPLAQKRARLSQRQQFSEVGKTLKEVPELKKLLALALPIMFFGFPFTAMLPMITETMLNLGSEQFGTLLAVSAAGALLASSQLSARPDDSDWSKTLLYAGLFGVALLGLTAAPNFAAAAGLLFCVGYFSQAYRTSSRMLFQQSVPVDKAGSLLGLALMDRGMIPLGGLLIGAAAEYIDIRVGVSLMGLGCLLTVLCFAPQKFSIKPRFSVAGLVLGLLSLLILGGCAIDTPTRRVLEGPSRSVQHNWGQTEVPLQPKRIVVLDLPFLDAMSALGQPVSGFAGTSQKTVPSYLQEHLPSGIPPVFVGERKQPNLEVILSLKPDLIVANPDRHKMIRHQLESMAPTIALTDDSLTEVLKIVRVFGEITERDKKAQELEERLQTTVNRVKELRKEQPSVLVVGAFEDEFSTWTKASFVGSLFSEIGCDYLFTGPPSASESQTEVAKITIENLTQLDPEYLFVYGNADRWQNNPLYSELQSFQKDQIRSVDRDLWSRARGPVAAELILDMYSQFLTSDNKVASVETP